MRYFNLHGECVPGRHYMLPTEGRLPDARQWIERREYFLVHAPRQTGKTTTLSMLAESLTREGKYIALRFSCERAESSRDDVAITEKRVLDAIRTAAIGRGFPAEWMPPDPWPDATPGSRIIDGLQDWAVQCPLPLVLVFDEIDTLRGDSLNSVLRQIRDGYSWRGHGFPVSIALCGMRHLRDYKLAAGSDAPVRPGRASPFNIAESARIGDFTAGEVAELYAQHTGDTGQEFTPEATARAFEYTQGQPWLVNALAHEITDKMRVPLAQPITADHMDTARERLIARRETHLDSLATRLEEPRVKKVIQPILTGTLPESTDSVYQDEITYARDLGLIARNDPIRIANPIYREIIARVLASGIEGVVTADPHCFTLPDGRLDIPRLLAEFTDFWIENGEWLASGTGYNEAGAQLVFMAFLHRMVNGDGYVDREFAIGSGRIDILIRRPLPDGTQQREAFELKVWRDRRPDPLPRALTQFDGYLSRFGLDSGTLVIFDRREDAAPIHERTETTTITSPAGHAITLLRG